MREHGVNASVGTRNYKASFNYDQIAARNDDRLACECRGLVLATPNGSPFPQDRVVGETVVLARPMDRFFNLGQAEAPKLDLAHPETRVFDKLDGSLCLVSYDSIAAEWCVSTRSVPDADKSIDGFGEHTFRTLFEHALEAHAKTTFAELTSKLSRDATYCFELTTPHNRVVVDYPDPSVHLLAVRNVDTGKEVCPGEIDGLPVPTCPSHQFAEEGELLAFVSRRPPTQHEGVVARMPGFRRVKIKSAAYVAASGLKSSAVASPRALLSIILDGQYDDAAPMLPAHVRERGDAMRHKLGVLYASLDDSYNRLLVDARRTLNVRKELALSVQREGLWMAPMMARFIGKCRSAAEFVALNRSGVGWSDSFCDTLLDQMKDKYPT